MDKLRRILSGNSEETEERGLMAQISDASSLSWSTRIKGFLICFVTGFLMSIIGASFVFLPNGLSKFCKLYTLGNIASIASTLFLMGPMNQLKRMFNESRWVASTAAMAFCALTLISGLYWSNKALTLFCCILQFLAMTWYSLSYIPLARTAVKNTLGAIIA